MSLLLMCSSIRVLLHVNHQEVAAQMSIAERADGAIGPLDDFFLQAKVYTGARKEICGCPHSSLPARCDGILFFDASPSAFTLWHWLLFAARL